MKITFKDVGQGDSIILEWDDKGKYKVGIIDCNLKGKNLNPILDHLKRGKTKEIEFIILSHPHKDHYSGLEELLDYVVENNLIVKRFAHTLKDQGSIYWWRWFEKNTKDVQLLVRIMKMVKILRDKGNIKRVQALSEDLQITLSDQMYLKCLSPSMVESEKYQGIVKIDPDKNIKQASAAANYLSTVFKLKTKDQFVLLTSDAEVLTFKRIMDDFPELKNWKFSVCQLPHHGSKKNHCIPFWEWIETKNEEKTVVVSSGRHHQYHHPDYETVKWFYDRGFVIKATNVVYGVRKLNRVLKRSLKIDGVSEVAEEFIVRGDKVFHF